MNNVSQRSFLFGLLALALIAVVTIVAITMTRTDTAELRAEARRQYERGNHERAEELCLQILSAEPTADDIRLVAADCASKNRRPEQACEQLQQITTNDPEIQLQASLMLAELLHRSLYRLSEAESAYSIALRLAPDNSEALTGMVQLLAVCGRRREALPFLFGLVRKGEASDLLIIAARSSGAINDEEFLRRAFRVAPNDGCVLLGLALQSARAGQTESAVRYCREAITAAPELSAAQVALGQYLLDAGRYDELVQWHSELTDEARKFAETWQVIGLLFEHQKDSSQALQNFLTAVRLGPDLKTTNYRLSVLCRQAGDESSANYFSDRLNQLRELEVLQDRMFEAGQSDPSAMVTAVRGFQQCGRIWEALGWATLGLAEHGQNPDLLDLYQQLQLQARDLPLSLYANPENTNRTVDITIAAQNIKPAAAMPLPSSGTIASNDISFHNEASACGLHFRFRNGVVGPTTHRMFEFTGGGIGIVDLDLDEYPDAFLSQGGLWHTAELVSDANDSLFRNRLGRTFSEVTEEAGIKDQRFGQGVAVGDVNNDGFPDILVANIGSNCLWLNCGDGTFTGQIFAGEIVPPETPAQSAAVDAEELPQDDDRAKWSTSAAIADLNQDGAADAYIVNYLAGHDVFSRICVADTGEPQACIPVQFDAASDHIYLNQQDGGFLDASRALAELPAGKGLGVLVFSPLNDGQPGIYVANDTTPNMLLQLDRLSLGHVDDVGMEKGVALNAAGKAEGSMGIAAADINADGLTELFVTNFYNESNTLYQQTSGSFFDDRTREWNLRESSLPLLGFGTQFLDANHDTLPELFVANGHVDDLRRAGKPYKMPAQLLAIRQDQFQEIPAAKPGHYFHEEHLGRAVAVFDWNRDLRPDLMVGHLDEDYALLTNTSKVNGGCAALRLVGVRSARDAVPATASYSINNKTLVQQLQAGNGYFCSNQKQMLLASGAAGELSEVTICWPSGEHQSFKGLNPGRRYVLIENRNRIFLLPD